MAEILRLARGVDPHAGIELDLAPALAAAFTRSCEGIGSPGGLAAARPSIQKRSSPVSPSDPAASPAGNCSGSTPMPIRLERWMRSKLSAITALTPSSLVPLAAQSREDPVPYSRAGEHDQLDAFGGVAHGGLVDRHLLGALV